jgi:hypothetical protein
MRFVSVAWIFGAVWITATAGAPLTRFAKGLGASRFEFGVLAAIPFMATLLSLVGSFIIEKSGRRKELFLAGLYTQRLLWLVLAPVSLFVLHRCAPGHTGPALMVFLTLMFLQSAGWPTSFPLASAAGISTAAGNSASSPPSPPPAS